MVEISCTRASGMNIIVDLSSSKDASANNTICRQYAHRTYLSFDDAAHVMHHLGEKSLISKIDIKHACRIIPVHPED